MIRKNMIFIFMLLILCFTAYSAPEKNHVILGTEKGDGLLVYPRQIKEGPDGCIYVYDRSDVFIKVYSPEGKYLRRIGGKGQGPGEIQREDGADFGFTPEGKLYFTESFGGHRWITVMGLSGEFDKVVHPDINEVFGIANSCALEDGGFLLEIWYMFKPEMKEDYFLYRYPQVLIRINSEGKTVSTIIKTNYFKTISSGAGGADQWLPIFPAFAWIPWREDTVIFADGLSKNFNVYDYDGRLVRKIETTLPDPDNVTEKDLEAWRRERKEVQRDKSWYERFGKVVEKYKKSIYDKKPNLSGISLTPGGNILVSIPETNGETTINYWLINNTGKTLAQANLNCDMLQISKNFVLFRTTDKDGNYLVHCLTRMGDERDDLLRLKELSGKSGL
jgi:hypothetical protein